MNPDEADALLNDVLNDPDAWGEPVPARQRRSEKRRRGVVVSVRFTPDELAYLSHQSEAMKIPLGALLRQSALTTGPVVTRLR